MVDVGTFDNNRATYSVRTDSNGIATAQLRAPFNSTTLVTATVQASLARFDQPVLAEQVEVVFVPVQVGDITVDLEITAAQLPANGSSTTAVSVSVRTDAGQPLPGVPVELTTTRGTFDAGTATTTIETDATGTARAMLRSALGQQQTSATVTARVDAGGQVTIAEDSVLFIVPATADTSALPPEIRSDVRDQAVILAQIQDSTGSPVPAYPVVVTTSLGRFANAAQ
ncbi:MAG: hypothetical protein HC876_20965, partial [Chloroflexaceae bacterium]|nr:hypothetical protein [Chloroflexaceae bacterium]